MTPARAEAGFSLMETIAATVIAVIAVVGLAYTFGVGRASIDRFEIARAADALAQSRIEYLVTLARVRPSSDSLEAGVYPSPANPFLWHGRALGTESWTVASAPGSVPLAIQANMIQVTATVAWNTGTFPDSVSYTRLIGVQ